LLDIFHLSSLDLGDYGQRYLVCHIKLLLTKW